MNRVKDAAACVVALGLLSVFAFGVTYATSGINQDIERATLEPMPIIDPTAGLLVGQQVILRYLPAVDQVDQPGWSAGLAINTAEDITGWIAEIDDELIAIAQLRRRAPLVDGQAAEYEYFTQFAVRRAAVIEVIVE